MQPKYPLVIYGETDYGQTELYVFRRAAHGRAARVNLSTIYVREAIAHGTKIIPRRPTYDPQPA